MNPVLYLLVFLFAAFSTPTWAQETAIFEKGEKAPNVHHTGDIWLNHLSAADSSFAYNIALATCAPGSRLDWHLHPAGQQLLVTAGVGYYQERNKLAQIVRQGDVIKCSPGVAHWHAASAEIGVTYLAITGNQPTQWLERVSDEDYHDIKPTNQTMMNNTDTAREQEVIHLSKDKWDWMAAKEIDTLAALFHEKAVFVHMGGSWGKEQELQIIKSGRIHYKQADIHEVSVNIIDNTAVLLNRITLLAVVGGNEVTNPFMVTEVYIQEAAGQWQLASLSFTKLLN